MSVPVVWLSLVEGTPPRGYWDEGMLEALFARDLWEPSCPLTYEHHEAQGLAQVPEVDGAVLVLPARYHAEPREVTALARLLQGWRWGLVILTGDEESTLPWRKLKVHPGIAVWVQTPRPDLHLGADGLLPNGWPPGIRERLREPDAEAAAAQRRWEWCFAGQVTHDRREALASVLRQMEGGWLLETPAFTAGVEQSEYWLRMASAKVAPCPSGPVTVDTFRVYEALEAGCFPVVDGATPGGNAAAGYWPTLFGQDPPFPVVVDWARDLPGIVRQVVRRWPTDANRASSWWQGKKRVLAWRLDEQVRALGGAPAAEPTEPDDLITVIVPTSPVPRHPATDHLEETLASIRERLPRAEIILVCDQPRPELAHRGAAYQEYLRRVCWRANLEWRNVRPLVLPSWQHQAMATRAALRLVRTPLMLFVEHDTPLVGEIPWGPLCEVLQSGAANVVRCYHEVVVHPDHRHLMLGEPEYLGAGAPLLRTMQWSQRPHLARVEFYRERIMPMFSRRARTMIEDVVHGAQDSDFTDRGEAAWWDWRTYLLHPETPVSEGGVKRSTHLDSRESDPKYSMVP